MNPRTLYVVTRAALVAALLSGCGDESQSAAGHDAGPGGDTHVEPADARDDGGHHRDAYEADGEPRGDTDGGDTGAPEPTVHYLYDPFAGELPTTLPDDALTVADDSSATGVRIRIDDRFPWYAASTGLARNAYSALDGLDGWGLNAAIALVFDAPVGEVPSGAPESVDNDALRLYRLDDAGATRVPFEARHTEDGSLLVWPMIPLDPAKRHGLIATTAVRGADGGAIDPGPTLRALLEGRADGDLAAMNPRYAGLLDASALAPDEVAFAVVFTTQDALAESRAIAAGIRERDYAWEGPRDCVPDDGIVHCEGAFEAWSWRDESGAMGDGDPVRQYRLPVSAWLPEGSGPHQTAIFGHGLVHDRDVGEAMARIVVPLGIAVIAIDAVVHGDHPDASDDDALVLFDFFAVTLDPIAHDPLRLRDNFRQSTWDKLQLLRLLELDSDIDGDCVSDLDLTRMIYIGESFGGIMGIELLALTDRFKAAALQLGGGNVTTIISDARRFQAFTLLAGGGQDPSDTARFFPIIQVAVDAGDASTWAPWVLRDRLPEIGGTPPHLLLQLVDDDDTVPTISSNSLVRALGVPHTPPVVREVPMVELTGPTPLSANAADGTRTESMFQFDRIRRSPDAEIEPASHDYMPASIEGTHQVRAFIESWSTGSPPTIVDPYEALATPPLDRDER